MSRQPRKGKYNNVKVKRDGYTFDSKREDYYYLLYKSDPEVAKLGVHPRYVLVEKYVNPEGVKRRAITYVADFLVTYHDGREEVVDVKGVETDVFKIKRVLFERRYGKAITIVK